MTMSVLWDLKLRALAILESVPARGTSCGCSPPTLKSLNEFVPGWPG